MGSSSIPYTYSICWTGYVRKLDDATTGTTGVIVGEELEHLGLRAGPNPTGAGVTLWFRLGRGGPIKLAIHDAQGRLVRSLKSGNARPGEQSVRWDGLDQNGKKVDSGLYFASLETPGEIRSAKIVRIE